MGSSRTAPAKRSRTESGRMVKKMKKRICLVLDCLCAHDFSDQTADLINLQHYVIKEKRLSERETVVIFYGVVLVVEALHQKNIVHRDIKLGTLWPAGAKPSDMWALGVVLFTMLYGQFPFYDSIPQELFRKIKAAEYTPSWRMGGSLRTQCVLTPQQRLAALSVIIVSCPSLSSLSGPLQVVPDIDDQISNSDSSQEAKVREECSQHEFENYMRQQLLLAEEKSSIHEAQTWVPKRQFSSMPPVRRLGHNAKLMTSLDTSILAQRYLRK
ncbi:hypothetical protein A6R68_21944 [Neotoma lepida]|uniref:Protein kinase domain-containing protein n=1 Tax=Neotoma lepida TaxID=56216 RepID=A0A1A6HNN3_NEOLE|nr:hypothetical protein A6R68_21944 [Neotoma lepida]